MRAWTTDRPSDTLGLGGGAVVACCKPRECTVNTLAEGFATASETNQGLTRRVPVY